MKRLHILLAALFLIPAATVLAANDFYVVKITQLSGEFEFQVMSKDQLKEFEKQCNVERRYYTSAVRTAEKQWKDNNGKPFPKGMSRRKISVLGSSGSESAANGKLSVHLEGVAEEKEEDRKRMIKKVNDRYPIFHNMHGNDLAEAKRLRRERIQHLEAEAAASLYAREQAGHMVGTILAEKTGGHNTKPKEVKWSYGKPSSKPAAPAPKDDADKGKAPDAGKGGLQEP